MDDFKLKRQGVVLQPQGDIGAIFNPAAIEHEGSVLLLPRVVRRGYTKRKNGYGYDDYISEIWLARSKDGKNFTLDDGPIIKPFEEYDKYGCEDPRVVKLDGKYIITYTAGSKPAFVGDTEGDRIGLASTVDFKNIKKHGVVGPNYPSKAGVFFPERINGKALLLLTKKVMKKIHSASFDGDIFDEKAREYYWENWIPQENVILSPQNNGWEDREVETGAQPIKTDKGWLLIYSGISTYPKWSVGAALLDLENPRKVIARSPTPILEPEAEYEKTGDIPDVVFPEGAIVLGDELFVYYGAADKVCALATCKLSDLLNFLLKHRKS